MVRPQSWLPLRGRWLRYLWIGLAAQGIAFLIIQNALLRVFLNVELMTVGSTVIVLARVIALRAEHPGRMPVPVQVVAAALACLSGVLIIRWAVSVGLDLTDRSSSRCGTCRAGGFEDLMVSIPYALIVPVAASVLLRGAPIAGAFARCATIPALVTWLGVVCWSNRL